ncbi:MAG: hypothetical protein Q8R81_09395 [Novosphingobium sp.]|nr:hypothetical protein [Novosphingobium sp.]MDP3550598.1 hypothetical protein [Novosphingobium sp.]
MTLTEAIREVEQGRCQRIAAPGKWRVWRDGDQVKHERIGGDDLT